VVGGAVGAGVVGVAVGFAVGPAVVGVAVAGAAVVVCTTTMPTPPASASACPIVPQT
jgi:hypothetical protein